MITIKNAKYDKLSVFLFETRGIMAVCAANDVIQKIKELSETRDTINVMFAAAPSQNEFLETLACEKSIPWEKINAFHMDEYIGYDTFVSFLRKKLFDRVPLKHVFCLDGKCANAEAECARYTELMRQYPMDIICMGIGENGHLAFNDPHIARFEDSESVKIVDLDEKCRWQQVNDRCFGSLEEVPKQAMTVTIPELLRANFIACVVPGEEKAEAVYRALQGNIEEACPASILRRIDQARLYIDKNSGKKLNFETFQ